MFICTNAKEKTKAHVFIICLLLIALVGCGVADKGAETIADAEEPEIEELLYPDIQDGPIEWVDSVFEAMIRKGLDKPEGVIMRSELDFVTILSILGEVHVAFNDTTYFIDTLKEYTDNGADYALGTLRRLDDAKNFRNLEFLRLSYNKIDDLNALEELTNLTALELFRDQVSDISALTELTGLTYLDLYQNQISDISPLAGLTNLMNLNLEDNPISDWSPVAHVPEVDGRPQEYAAPASIF
jgi:hypothetical protein